MVTPYFKERRIEWLLFAVAFITFAYFHQGGGWNQNVRFAMVRSMVEEGRFSIDSVHWVFAMAFALPWLALRWRAIVKRFWLFIAATGASAVLLLLTHRGDAPYALAPVAGLGAICLADVIVDSFQRRDGLQCALGT